MPPGYYRFPTLHNDTVVFVSEDDLWSVPSSGGIPHRLTSNLGEASRPLFSPDGSQLAYVGRDEGQPEIYLMPALGGPASRLTYLSGSICLTAGWTQDGKIIFANNAGHWYLRFTHLYIVAPEGQSPEKLKYGLARAISFGPNGGVLLGRHTEDPARWKRYRGGTIGQLWIDETGRGEFQPLLPNLGNLTSPMWLHSPGPAGRIYFISDHEGIGNLYSCLPSGDDLLRHTRHENFYVRSATTDGRRIVYHAGAELYLFDPASNQTALIPIEYHSPQVQRRRKYINPAAYLDGWELHPRGHSTVITARGKMVNFANWEGAVIQQNDPDSLPDHPEPAVSARYRLPAWLSDGKRLVAVCDAGGEEKFVVLSGNGGPPEVIPVTDIGRPIAIAVNPCKDQIIFGNHRYELLCLDLKTSELRKIDRGSDSHIRDFCWSPDGEWVVYSVSINLHMMVLKLWNASSGEITQLTQPVLRDIAPSFDPQGKYIYFLSHRTFDPVFDQLHLELSFPRGMKPYLITLQEDAPSPFIPTLPVLEEPDTRHEPQPDGEEKPQTGDAEETEAEQKHAAPSEQNKPKPIRIDLTGIQQRLVAFPVNEGLYGRVLGAADGKVFYSRYPLAGSLNQSALANEPETNGTLLVYNFEDQKEEVFTSGITSFKITADGKFLIYRAGNDLRVVKASEKPANDEHGHNRKSGWLDLSRLRLAVAPGAEWKQMYREAWRLQRDQFWTEDMSQVDWLAIYDRYLPLVGRVGSRSEFSDLMWEMQGELGTSHAYEFGGDYRPEPRYLQGFLGAEFEYESASNGWRITHIYQGDPWDEENDSPFNNPGVNLNVGDCLLAINGKKLSSKFSPAMALVNLADQEVNLTISPATPETGSENSGAQNRSLSVRTLKSETQLRYRNWVETNRRRVHEASSDRLGYVHIPDMGPVGYAEFHRGFLAEAARDGLIVDVRFNRGGFVSALILEKLSRRRIGYSISRWGQNPEPYPDYAIAGPMVALTNENAGSDGDIFSHGFKLMKLGPLVGKRTWGGVIGITVHHELVDGSITTQPEFSTWFSDVGWNLENYGTDPDIEVDIRPQDYAAGADPQLERSIAEALRLLAANPPQLPDFSSRPSRAAPRLPSQ
ncbi:MAG: PDZ domain-containing protein [Anaerolineales bacterium]|nr:PDZ domain-containing protein [Anaerolineales bacterium]